MREGDDVAALREAALRPRIPRDFLSRYNGSRLPSNQIGRNVLEELGVPSDRTAETLQLIVENAKIVGFLREMKGGVYVDLQADMPADSAAVQEEMSEPASAATSSSPEVAAPLATVPALAAQRKTNRVFITHGRNHDIVQQLKELLTFGGFTPVVALDNETVSKPVPDKVLDEMRSCDAAVIHVGAELQLIDTEGKAHRVLNQNVSH